MQLEIRTGELLVPEPIRLHVTIANVKFKNYKSPGSERIPAELIEARGETLRSEIRKRIKHFWNKEELPILEGVYFATNLRQGR
jgi:hypothetical protein